jgi:hypothetical protein
MNLHLSHNDLDGITALLLSKKLGLKHYFPCAYNPKSKYYVNKIFDEFIHNEQFIKNIKNILFTDINLTEEIYEHIKTNLPEHVLPKNVFIIDHHQNSEDSQIEFKKQVDTNYCASKQYYDIIVNKYNIRYKEYEDFINAVDGWDCWEFSRSTFSVDLQRTFQYFIFNRKCYDKFYDKLYEYMDLVEKEPPTQQLKPKWYNNFLKEYYKINQELVDEIVKKTYNKKGLIYFPFIGKYKDVPAFEVELQLMKKDPKIQHFMFLFDDNDGNITISLRTNNGEKIDVSQIAMENGGGGHSEAASFRIKKEKDLVKTKLSEIAKRLVGAEQ